MSKLFSQLQIKDVTFRNRIGVSPMCMYSSEDGFANDWHFVHLGSRAVGGAALILLEATAVTPEGRISAQDLGLWKDEHIEQLRRITRFIHAHGAIAGIQLAHAGRKASTHRPWEGGRPLQAEEGAWQTEAPSAIAFSEEHPMPKALSLPEVNCLIHDFAAAAERALQAGFKVIEIHAAHGYLIHEFLSPLSNHRTDIFGGSFENRVRFLLEIIDAVKEVWPDNLPLLVRISATDWVDGGWTIEDSVALATILKHKGVDLIDCSSGGNVRNAKIPVGPGYQVPFSEQIRYGSAIATAAVGLITEARQAETIIAEGKADMVFLAREFLRDPYFPLHAAKILGAEVKVPDQYGRAF